MQTYIAQLNVYLEWNEKTIEDAVYTLQAPSKAEALASIKAIGEKLAHETQIYENETVCIIIHIEERSLATSTKPLRLLTVEEGADGDAYTFEVLPTD